MRVALHPAFILHHRPYRETSLLLDVFTQEHGRLSLISRGVRKTKSPMKAILQPFNSLLISWAGKSELMTLTSVDPDGPSLQPTGAGLLSGFYLNEVLTRVLQKQDPQPHLYTVYRKTLVELQSGSSPEKCLRLFEKRLLEELGYGLQLHYDIATAEPIMPDRDYRYVPEQGFKLYEKEQTEGLFVSIFAGKSLIALANEELNDADCLRDIKRLMRMVLTPLLGPQPLQTRKLFIEIEK